MVEQVLISKEEYDSLLKKAGTKKVLLWEGFDKNEEISKVFTQNQILLIEDCIINYKYLPTIWGDWTRQRNLTLFYIIYLLALRPLEACSLRFDDFDMERMILNIRAETNKQKLPRQIPIPKQLVIYIKDYLKFPRYLWNGSPYLFPSFQDKNNPISAGRWKHFFRDVLKSAGIWKPPVNSTCPPFRSYTLRHTRASELLSKSDMDIHAVANILGHKNLNSTKRYLHQNKEYQKYLRNILEAY